MFKKLWAYIEVCKIRETVLLTFIGLASCIVAFGGSMTNIGRILFTTATVLVASAGANGITNYLDRDLDAKMARTQKRVFPTKRIDPASKALPWLIFLVVAGLIMSYFVSIEAALFDFVGSIAAFVFRKRNTCVFPQGALASIAPITIGWYGGCPDFTWQIGIMCLMICFWLPLHVWTVMISHRDEYIGAGCTFFPLKAKVSSALYLLLICAVALIGLGFAYYFYVGAGIVYLVGMLVLDLAMLISCIYLMFHYSDKSAWKLYKLSSFPYLGLLFLFMCLDLWIC